MSDEPKLRYQAPAVVNIASKGDDSEVIEQEAKDSVYGLVRTSLSPLKFRIIKKNGAGRVEIATEPTIYITHSYWQYVTPAMSYRAAIEQLILLTQ